VWPKNQQNIVGAFLLTLEMYVKGLGEIPKHFIHVCSVYAPLTGTGTKAHSKALLVAAGFLLAKRHSIGAARCFSSAMYQVTQVFAILLCSSSKLFGVCVIFGYYFYSV